MSAAARGAAGYLCLRRMKRAKSVPADALQQTEQHLRRFVGAERAKELAPMAVRTARVTYKRRRSP